MDDFVREVIDHLRPVRSDGHAGQDLRNAIHQG
jgi:hypothetical protein